MQATRTFAHAMLREIYEQPEALRATMARYAPGGTLDTSVFAPVAEALRGRQRVVIAASGSSRHAGLAGEIMLEDYAGFAVDVEYSSEYMYRSTHTLHDPGVMVISQSGETADTLASLREAKARGLATVAIVNDPDSTTAQAVGSHCEQLQRLPHLLEEKLEEWERRISAIAERLREARTFLYLGRAIHYAIAREGALKLKESAYVQAEGLPAGELKHGPNALVSPEAPLVMLATRDQDDPDSALRYEKTLQLMRDMHTQGAEVFAVHVEGDDEAAQLSRYSVAVPAADEFLLPMLEVVPLQMLAYFIAVQRGVNVDAPRNLVKAVVRE